jgi:hypothetical protein
VPRSLSAQALHYLSRPHSGAATAPIRGPAAWNGGELAARPNDWTVTLAESEIGELSAEVSRVASTRVRLADLSPASVTLPRLERRIVQWRDELRSGRGFVLVRGIPVQGWTSAESELFTWWLGLRLGVPGRQNERGDLVGHVMDTRPGGDARLYETSKSIRYHCDTCDVVGLVCLKKAKEGGLSRIASSVTVFNALFRERPALAARLYDRHPLDTHGQRGLDFVRVPPCRFSGGVLRTFYHADYFRSGGAKAGNDGAAELLDAYDAIAERPEIRLDMDLEPGDVQLVNNHTVIHARTAYVDHEAPAERRHLLRLWLSFSETRSPRDRLRAGVERLALLSEFVRQRFSSVRGSRRER